MPFSVDWSCFGALSFFSLGAPHDSGTCAANAYLMKSSLPSGTYAHKWSECSKNVFQRLLKDRYVTYQKERITQKRTFVNIFRKLPKTFEEDSKMLRSYTNIVKYMKGSNVVSMKSSMSLPWKIRYPSLRCGFVRILRVEYIPVKHLCLYYNHKYFSCYASMLHLQRICWYVEVNSNAKKKHYFERIFN